MEVKLFNIVAIVNDGYSDIVMEVAKEKGARGGTIITGNSTVSDQASKLYGLNIQPIKEVVLILVKEELVNPILEALYDKAGPNSLALGVFFTLPVTHASSNLLGQYKNEVKK